MLSDIRVEEGEATANRIGDAATFVHHDVSSEDEWRDVVRQVLDRHGRIDALINNAGISSVSDLLELPLEDYMRVIEINQVGVFLGMKGVGDRLATLFSVALGIGLRQSEALGLRWEDFNIDDGSLSVRRSLQRYDGAFHLDEPKTERSRRTLPCRRNSSWNSVSTERDSERSDCRLARRGRATNGAAWSSRASMAVRYMARPSASGSSHFSQRPVFHRCATITCGTVQLP